MLLKGLKSEVPVVIGRMFKIDNATINNIIANIEALDVLRLSDSHHKLIEESLVIFTTTLTPPMFGFVCNAVFQVQSCCSCIEITKIRIEIQIREDKSKEHLTIEGGSSCESNGFVHGVECESECKSILIIMSNQI